jgi:FtsP/CotA-like multicopper oxidase with cupredoxin domain
MRVRVRFEGIRLTILGAEKEAAGGAGGAGAMAQLDVSELDAHMSVWSDTAWQGGMSLAQVRVLITAAPAGACVYHCRSRR